MKIGFLTNQIDSRGTGNAVYNYAHYNEEILGNKSKILTLQSTEHSPEAFDKFVNRFDNIYLATYENLLGCDALYHIKSGENDGTNSFGLPYLVHSVFKSEVHGTRYAAISEWMGIRDSLPFVPHIVTVADTSVDFRDALGIPQDATVFGRHGGLESFDIPFAWEAIREILLAREDMYFLFLNTYPVIDHPRVMHFPSTLKEEAKRAFINTCDAMIHARSRGETFGISVGEFSILGKPIFTYGGSYEKAHIYELKGTAKTYNDKNELIGLLYNYHREKAHPFYDRFTPELVMAQFKEVFLD